MCDFTIRLAATNIYNLFYSLYKIYGENMCVVNIHYKEVMARILKSKGTAFSLLLSISY